MYKLWTMTFMAVILGLNLASAQGKSFSISSPTMTQSDWKVILKNLKDRNPETLKELFKDNGAIRIQGPGTSGGGNESDSEFYYLTEQIFRDFEAGKVESTALTFAKQAFEKLKAEKALFFTDKKIFLDGQPKMAINDYDVFVIIFDEGRWKDAGFALKRSIIVHELLGLARVFDPSIDDSTYSISNALFAKLDEENQKSFVLSSDYPKHFMPPTVLNAVIESSASLIYTENGKSEVCVSSNGQPTIKLEIRTTNKNGRDVINITHSNHCSLPDGEIISKSGGYADDTLGLVSGNLIDARNEVGRFILGWMSGEEFLIRTPSSILSVRKQKDGTFEFLIDTKYGPKQESFRGAVKP